LWGICLLNGWRRAAVARPPQLGAETRTPRDRHRCLAEARFDELQNVVDKIQFGEQEDQVAKLCGQISGLKDKERQQRQELDKCLLSLDIS
jgi:hypothetical protein